ncbi:ABC transporter ATP-binding protein [Salinibacterium sp. NK8237]|uniref:ABC transporter ATP-binding protein n=1 Tax=Salinibacterium sp. NK8237 TaxID=2792038 RepID=UPI0018CEA6CF|nr:ABC transporter ATP-binding protein [Salinibacterium sp. NK8237]MBH0130009.1 ABC transporter ATP-binding protein [Salinibacterium sp. NK8237]
MTLDTTLRLTRGSFVLDASVSVAPGETLALLGPNGSGKSTMLALIAGLLAPDSGTVSVNGRVLTDVPPARGGRMTVVPAHRRRIGLLGQDPLLFPHLSALENVAFGLRSQGMKVAEARQRAGEWIDAVGMTEFVDRKPAELSGGQQQRIAIARVLATEPDVLLFDEPMAALDVQNASLVRTLLRECLGARGAARGVHIGDLERAALPATIVVTHDVVDAMVLADRVAIVDAGRIIDSGDVERVLGQPVNQFAATLVGLNLLDGIVETPDLVRLPDGRRFAVAAGLPAVGLDVSIAFPPAAVAVNRMPQSAGSGAPESSSTHTPEVVPAALAAPAAPPNSWHATVAFLEPGLQGIRVTLQDDTVVAEVLPADLLTTGIAPGDWVTASVDPTRISVYSRR